MRWMFVLVVILTTPVFAKAGDTHQLHSLLESYAGHSQRLQDVRAARKNGSLTGDNEMLELKKDLLAAIKAVDIYRGQLLRGKEEPANHEVPLALKYAYLAMFQAISAELDHYLFKSKLALIVSDKYVDIWRSVDASIPRPSPSS